MPLLGYTTWLVMPSAVMDLGPAYAARAALISPEGEPTAAASLASYLLSIPSQKGAKSSSTTAVLSPLAVRAS